MSLILIALVYCSLSENDLGGSGSAFGQALKDNLSLKFLIMTNCGLEHNDVRELSGGMAVNTSMTYLNLSFNDTVSAESISLILQCPSLRKVRLALPPSVNLRKLSLFICAGCAAQYQF